MNIIEYMQNIGQQARLASKQIAAASTQQKNQALLAIAEVLAVRRDVLLSANGEDVALGERNDLESALLDRLLLTNQRIDSMIEGLKQIAALPDPCGEISDLNYRPSGLQVGKMRVPLGVIGIIYESRPNVTIDAASLCLKSGNATILRGGKEAFHSNRAIADAIQAGLQQAQLPAAAVQVIETTDRAAVGELITMNDCVDVIVPRGGRNLIDRVSKDATVSVIKHLDGLCHIYIDDKADLDKAYNVALNAKTYRYGICGAMETLLVAEAVAEDILPRLARGFSGHQVELRGCARTQAIIDVQAASDEDWSTEYLAPILSVAVVDNMDAAIAHIDRYSSGHTDAIITQDLTRARQFMTLVDSSSVMVNAPTCFADGFEYGLGAEIGISTNKIHARGPVGLEGLTSQKWIVLGDGQTR